jgi:WD40 repeat protein
LITGSNDSLIRLYQTKDQGLKLLKKLECHPKGITSLSYSESHKIIVSCAFDFDVLVWNAYL